ncbi:hypothetical protein TBK1r_10730 [Stieleria magnilauensis]|uniref:Uncharacterized protein n=1 Tax=Stieleria magnilauensis TaxID=2527963 RepID=A0ABX5XJJ1_9BACT|nr:hypothetical protein TBK1r_10730 [Planctomycetes bacterium TBK1r]
MDTFKHRWTQLPISRQLIVLVNAILFGFVVSFLLVDYRLRIGEGWRTKRSRMGMLPTKYSLPCAPQLNQSTPTPKPTAC